MVRAGRWQEFLAVQDAAARRAAHSVKQWSASIVVFALILVALELAPGAIGGHVGLAFAPALGLWLALGVLQLVTVVLSVRRPRYDSFALALSLVSVFLLQTYLGVLIDLVSPHAAPVFGSLFALVATYHAIQFRSARRFPFVPAISAVAAGVAWAFAPTPAHETVLAVVGPLTAVAGLLSAGQALASHEVRREQDRLKEALRSQELVAARDEIERLGSGIKHLLGSVHDIANALGTIRAEADLLALSADAGDLVLDELRETSAVLLGSVEAAAKVAHEAKQVGRGELLSPVEPVALEPVVNAALAAARLAHPGVTFVAARAHENVCVRVRGGAPTLRRMLENLLLNAVQGDGTRGARHVELSLERDGTGLMAALHVADDGPGFRISLLQEPIRALDTTKKDGTGVGLFTVERFAMASGGRLERRNRDEGGAQVSLVLRQEHA